MLLRLPSVFLLLTASKVIALELIQVEKDHLYTWEQIQSDGTPLYYGLELGMKGEWGGREKMWSYYYQQAHSCSQRYFKAIVGHRQVRMLPENFGEYIKPELREQLNSVLSRRGDKVRPSILGVSTGAIGKQSGENIAYISRKPIKGRMALPPPTLDRNLTLQEFYDHYKDIVMTVWVTRRGDGTVAYENRGIFRNPFSILFDEYKGLAIMIHAFTAVVMKKLYGARFFHVQPAPAMCDLLLRAFKRDEIFWGALGISRSLVVSIRP